MKAQEFRNLLRSNCLGEYLDKDGDPVVFYLDFDDNNNSMLIGTVCNVGFLVYFSVPYDDDFSLDENLQAAVEEIYSNGYADLN